MSLTFSMNDLSLMVSIASSAEQEGQPAGFGKRMVTRDWNIRSPPGGCYRRTYLCELQPYSADCSRTLRERGAPGNRARIHDGGFCSKSPGGDHFAQGDETASHNDVLWDSRRRDRDNRIPVQLSGNIFINKMERKIYFCISSGFFLRSLFRMVSLSSFFVQKNQS